MKIKIKNAIVSLSNKSKIDFLTKIFKRHNVNVISSGGTYKKIIKKYKKCTEVSKFTGFKEMLDGRVKTLHPKIFSGILCDRRKARHNKDLNKLDIPSLKSIGAIKVQQINVLCDFSKKIYRSENTPLLKKPSHTKVN